ncbi:phosphoribosyltransferase [Streptomyces sp. NRRL B-24484]|uniref:phosphoribosyltransferase n=1 Tax=Streptomyces sp. NRRL B-24484 TaxID=1463833 RepID=UPI0004C0DD2A|nr:phosphoribosyltransferase family protein [Streptomyces sp. NRRL B-24484]
MRFHDREQAGRDLAEALCRQLGGVPPDPLVLALAPGGVPVGAAVATVLGAPFDVLVARLVCAPESPEVPVGALLPGTPPQWQEHTLRTLGLTRQRLADEVADGRAEVDRCEALYRDDRPFPRVRGRTVILVNDGLATGVVARAALRLLRERRPARLIMAAPVSAARATAAVQPVADELVCPHRSWYLRDVGDWYEDFHPPSDREVLDALAAVPMAS